VILLLIECEQASGHRKFPIVGVVVLSDDSTLVYDLCSIYHKVKKGQKRHCTRCSAALALYQKLIDINIQVSGKPKRSKSKNRPVRNYPNPEKDQGQKSNINQLLLFRKVPVKTKIRYPKENHQS
jgi:hypothetical protein